ncbi:phosphate acetyltransferase [Acinetobacter sp. MD2(2019)]|uniref:phosphate acetyltransferase n=1 Tax=Acinetobacter sp. MD2(2019) TaxID=2605273 RepID=UPI002D1EAA21|nr:phosphate acetyltransferase [Acinetobacter sp. MD2(2019)]MEB3754623.1 phosphate acetyltransferase [Acinetobacter sp. MD2(2019)]
MNTLLLIPTAESVGLTSACLGMIYALDSHGIQAGFIKPFSQSQDDTDHGTASLYHELFKHPTADAITHADVLRAIATDEIDELLEDAVRLHRETAKQHQIVIVEGLVATAEDYFANELNAQLAKALDAKVILVSKADLGLPQQSAKKIEASLRYFGGTESRRVAGILFMRTKGLSVASAQIPVEIDPSLRLSNDLQVFTATLQQYNRHIGSDALPIIGVVPFSDTLSVPRTLDIAKTIQAEWVHQGEAEQRRIQHSSLIASSIEHELSKFVAGELIISASERVDVILASSLATQKGIPLAGLVLTERNVPNAEIFDFCQQAIELGLPILHTPLDSLETAQRLAHLNNEVPATDLERAKQVCRFVASHIDPAWLSQQNVNIKKPRLSPAAFRYELVQKSIAVKKRIVLPEGDEPRTVEAAVICQLRGLADCILLAKPESVQAVAQARGIQLPDNLEIIDPDRIRAQYIAPMLELRKGKLNEAQAEQQLQDTVVLGTMMLALNQVDGLVSGAVHTTANTVRPAFQLIKTAPDYSLVSSIFFMLLPDEVYVYGDCAINPDPNAEQLAEIAIQSADSAIAFGIEPRIAMISYSTGTSGAGADVEKVAQATEIAKQRRPDLLIDGPLQYDAASVESVGLSKAPNSAVAGHANVFIFPDLNTGNTTYKAVQRSANVISVGPMLQGLNKPVNDLSRGALVDDIVFTIALTAIQAQQQQDNLSK